MQTVGGGRYELEAEIAKGAIGTVWRGRDTGTGERVAIKLLRPEVAAQPDLVEAFLAEARIIADLDHPCIVRARELVRGGDTYALVLDLVNGQDLRRRLRVDGPLPPAVAADVVAQVADALDYLHGRGIVHGDIKPGNILVPVDGSPVRPGFPEPLWPVILECLALAPDARPEPAAVATRLRGLRSALDGLAPLARVAADQVTWWPRAAEETAPVSATGSLAPTSPASGDSPGSALPISALPEVPAADPFCPLPPLVQPDASSRWRSRRGIAVLVGAAAVVIALAGLS